MQNVTWCSSCLNMSTRPRITFNEKGQCNACQWMEEKKSIDWSVRNKELLDLLDFHRSKDKKNFDVIVPVSGGKDGSYVAYQLKHKYGMNPLCVTVRPALESELGKQNLNNFINSGFDHIHISPDTEIMQKLNKIGFTEMGFPYYGWLCAISSAVPKLAAKLDINLIFYGEDGEVEYGGSSLTKNEPIYSTAYQKNIYLENGYEFIENSGVEESKLYWYTFPDDKEAEKISMTHWSYFENWDSYRNYLIAKEHCGLLENKETNTATFTNFAQNDQALYHLHAYLMYLKFGFGRATQDAGIEIRRGSMTRDQAISLVQVYQHHLPEDLIQQYLEYYEMDLTEFKAVLAKWVNKDLFEYKNDQWLQKFSIK